MFPEPRHDFLETLVGAPYYTFDELQADTQSGHNVVGTVLVTLLAVMWLIVGKRTVQGAWRGELFVSPCIAGLKK